MQGLEVLLLNLPDIMSPGDMIDGELVLMLNDNDSTHFMDRKTANGLLNSLNTLCKKIKTTTNPDLRVKLRNELQDITSRVVYVVWDLLKADDSKPQPYQARFECLTKRVKALPDIRYRIQLVESAMAKDFDEVVRLFDKAIVNGHEGVIAKNTEANWVNGRTFDMVKFKTTQTADLRVVGIETGTGRNKGLLGALICCSEDHSIIVKVGTGFSDQQRVVFTKQYIIGAIVEIAYNARITKKVDGTDSLYLPRFIEVRRDKTLANFDNEIL